MAQRTKRQRQTLNQELVKGLKLELDCFNEEKEKKSYGLRDLVRDLQPQIATALDNNWSWREIADVLTKKGIQISPDTLQQYYREVIKNVGSTPKRKTSKANAKQVEQAQLEIESEDWEEEEHLEPNTQISQPTNQKTKFNQFDLSKV